MTERRFLLNDIFIQFLKLGLIAFGGPLAHIAYFRIQFVERRGWLSEQQFAQLLAICQFLPGPASSQLGFAIGLNRGGWAGALLAFIAFTLPSALLLLAFASVLPLLSHDYGQAIIGGLKLVAAVIVADAVLSMSRQLCPDMTRRFIAAVVAVVLILFGSTWLQLTVVLIGAISGTFFYRQQTPLPSAQLTVNYSKKTALLLLGLFLLLSLGLPVFASSSPTLLSISDAFFRAGALVFGGGHVVLPLLEESVVASGWINQQDFVAGYGAAQAVPGPLFSFSAYLGNLIPTPHSPFITAAVALLALFLPGFLLLAGCLPFWQSLSRYPAAVNALAGVNAVVVGLLAATLFDPVLTSAVTDLLDIIIILLVFICYRIWRFSPLYVVMSCVAAKLIMALFS